MKHINEATYKLSEKITYDTLVHLAHLDEAGFFDKVKGAAKNVAGNIASNVKNNVGGFAKGALSALGSSSARGSFKQNRAAKYLMDKFKEYRATNNKPWTTTTLMNFLKREFGNHMPAGAVPSGASGGGGVAAAGTGGTPPNPPTSPASPSGAPSPTGNGGGTPPTNKGTPGAAANPAANPAVNAATKIGASKAPNATPKTAAAASSIMQSPSPVPNALPGNPTPSAITVAITQAAEAPKPNKTRVLQLVNQLLQTSKGSNPQDYQKAIANLQQMQVSYGDKIPELRQIDFSKFTESQIKTVIGFTKYLVENRITSKAAMNRAYARFFLHEAPAAAAPAPPGGTPKGAVPPTPPTGSKETTLTPAQVYNYLYTTAGHLLDANVLAVDDPEWTKMVKGFFGNTKNKGGGYRQDDDDDDDDRPYGGGYRAPNRPSGGGSFGGLNPKARINKTSLPSNLWKYYDPRDTISSFLAKLSDKNIKMSAKEIEEIMKAQEH